MQNRIPVAGFIKKLIKKDKSTMSYISEIFARQILDSRGNPTVEVDVITDEGALGRAAVLLRPSGTIQAQKAEEKDGKMFHVF